MFLLWNKIIHVHSLPELLGDHAPCICGHGVDAFQGDQYSLDTSCLASIDSRVFFMGAETLNNLFSSRGHQFHRGEIASSCKIFDYMNVESWDSGFFSGNL